LDSSEFIYNTYTELRKDVDAENMSTLLEEIITAYHRSHLSKIASAAPGGSRVNPRE